MWWWIFCIICFVTGNFGIGAIVLFLILFTGVAND